MRRSDDPNLDFWVLVGLLTAAAILFFLHPREAAGHSHYDAACCSGRDCRELAPTEYRFEQGQWFLRNLHTERSCDWLPLTKGRLWDGKGRIRPSHNFDMHGCFAQLGQGCQPLCIYVGGGV